MLVGCSLLEGDGNGSDNEEEEEVNRREMEQWIAVYFE